MTGSDYPDRSYLPPNEGKDIFKSVENYFKNSDINFANLEGAIAIVGDIRDGAEVVYDIGIVSIMPTLKRAMSLEEAISNYRSLIVYATERARRFMSVDL